jgi:GNAT superfamily N-acetyltransferase
LAGVTLSARIRRVTPDDWLLLRGVRLAALADAPYAFGSTQAEELRFDEAEWRSRAARFAWFVALDDATGVGVVGGALLEIPSARTLFSMWTAERSRGTGVAEALVNEVSGWARADGAAELVLWNADGNERARRFYQRLGFVRTGNRKQLRSNPAIGEDELRLALPSPAREGDPGQ